MLIPVSKITKYGRPILVCVYDTVNNKFKDINLDLSMNDRVLPLQDYLSCEISSIDIVTVVGKNSKVNEYVVSFGDNFLYSISKKDLLSYTISNAKLSRNNRLLCKDGKLTELGDLFPDSNIRFKSHLQEVQASSLGLAKKFCGTYRDKSCIVKFSKTNGVDLDNEIIYKKLADVLNVPCCNVIKSTYNNKVCCISFLHYNVNKDYFVSFKGKKIQLSTIINSLSKKSRIDFDKILLLDYLVNQQDRHMSNIALCNNELYPAFDNGECFNIGSIGQFSQNYRTYIERLDRNYLHSLLRFDISKINAILDANRFNIFMINYNNLFRR